jgi:hypothetical protein
MFHKGRARILSPWLGEGKYPDEQVQTVLCEAFGSGPLRYAREDSSVMVRTQITATGVDGKPRLFRSYIPMSLAHSDLPQEGQLSGDADPRGSLSQA